MITLSQQEEFRIVVHQAKREGWLEKGARMTATEAGTIVVVECTRPGSARRRSYSHDARWPYELLRDLAHGVWSTRAGIA
jgi:hypothetical protein